MSAYAVTWRGRERLGTALPASVRAAPRPFPARRRVGSGRASDGRRWRDGRAPSTSCTPRTTSRRPPACRCSSPCTISASSASRSSAPATPPATRAGPGGDRPGRRRPHRQRVRGGRGASTTTGSLEDRVVHVAPGLDEAPRRRRAVGGGRSRTRPVRAGGRDRGAAKNSPALVAAFDALAAEEPDVCARHGRCRTAGAWPSSTSAVDRARHRDRIRRLGWLEDTARRDLLAGGRRSRIPPSTRGSGFRRWRRCRPASRSSPPRRARCRRCSATRRCSSTRPTWTASPAALARVARDEARRDRSRASRPVARRRVPLGPSGRRGVRRATYRRVAPPLTSPARVGHVGGRRYADRSTPAFKEWAVVVRGAAHRRADPDVRKGGLREGGGTSRAGRTGAGSTPHRASASRAAEAGVRAVGGRDGGRRPRARARCASRAGPTSSRR